MAYCPLVRGLQGLVYCSFGRGRMTGYPCRANLSVKVLDFVQLGGPDLTVDSAIFEMSVIW